jgi:hypothetical protein
MILLPYYVNMRQCLDETQLSHDSSAVLCQHETVFRRCCLDETQLSHNSSAILCVAVFTVYFEGAMQL